ncbi:hypothetical protein F5146DRAFT_7880 [Armillaria mellea]|nr:hypothetical protein F5146DRAFT_7880 [Armillaria mellea]
MLDVTVSWVVAVVSTYTGASCRVSHAFITRVMYAPLPPELAPCVLSLFRVTYPSILSQIVIIVVIPSITNGLTKISNQISFILSSHHSSPPPSTTLEPVSQKNPLSRPYRIHSDVNDLFFLCEHSSDLLCFCLRFHLKRINMPFMEGPLSNHPCFVHGICWTVASVAVGPRS